MKHPPVLVLALLFDLLLVTAAFSQGVADNVDNNANSVVTLNVSVWNPKNRERVVGLDVSDIEVIRGKEKQSISFFSRSDVPLTAGILIDTSASSLSSYSSKFNEITVAADGAKTFIRNSHPANKYFIVSFSKQPNIALKTTDDHARVNSALDKISRTKPEGLTAFYDAVKLAFDEMNKETSEKKILLIVSDASDNSSVSKVSGVKELARRSGIQIYLVNLIREDEEVISILRPNPEFETIVEETGGRVFWPRKGEQINSIFEFIGEEVRNQYTIRFYPKSARANEWNKIKVTAADSRGRTKLSVVAPKGYFF